MSQKFEVSGFTYKHERLQKTALFVTGHSEFQLEVNGQKKERFELVGQSVKEWTLGYLFGQKVLFSDTQLNAFSVENGTISVELDLEHSPFQPAAPIKKLSAATLLFLTGKFQENSILYKETGTYHSAAIASPDGLISFEADIFRLNALYKCVGSALLQNTTGSILLTSGKICLTTVQLAQRLGISAIISRSAPLMNCLTFAKDHDILLVGFARGLRFSVFGPKNRFSG